MAAYGGRFLSVYDGTTEYALQRFTLSRHGATNWPPLHSCLWVFTSADRALDARFPDDSKLRRAGKVSRLGKAA